MKTLKIFTIVAITGFTGAVAGDMPNNNNEQPVSMQEDGRGGQGMQRQSRRGGPQNRRGGSQRNIQRIMMQLGLDGKQVEALEDIRSSMRNSMREQRTKMRGTRDMKRFLSAEGFDRASFVAKSMEQAKYVANQRADVMEKTFNILTPEQRLKFIELMNQERPRKNGKRR